MSCAACSHLYHGLEECGAVFDGKPIDGPTALPHPCGCRGDWDQARADHEANRADDAHHERHDCAEDYAKEATWR